METTVVSMLPASRSPSRGVQPGTPAASRHNQPPGRQEFASRGSQIMCLHGLIDDELDLAAVDVEFAGYGALVRAEKRIHGSDQQSCSPSVPP
jgi:hypothetical protein